MKHNLAPRLVHAQEPYDAGHHLVKAGGSMTGAKQNLASLECALDPSCFNSRCQPVRHAHQIESKNVPEEL